MNYAVSRVLDFKKLAESKLEITGCWANMNPPNAAHGTHSHPNNDPRPQREIFNPAVRALTAENTDQVVVKVRNGTF